MNTNNLDIQKKDELDLLHYIGIFFRYKFFIIIMTAVISLAALGFLLITSAMPPEDSVRAGLRRGDVPPVQ